MDGFKDTTRMRNMEGGSCFAHGGAVKKRYGGDVTRGAVDRGNRMSAEEAGESRIATERAPRRAPRPAPSPQRAGAAEPTSALSRKLSVLPSERGEMGRGPAGASYRNNPLIPDVIEGPLRRAGVLNRKAGGLATMPRGKK